MAAASRSESGSGSGSGSHGLSAAEVDELRVACVAAQKRAYCPYSKFRVGAALLISLHHPPTRTQPPNSTSTSETHIISGANVENAAYPSGTCAERVALNSAIFAHGSGRGRLHDTGATSRSGDHDHDPDEDDEKEPRAHVVFLALAVVADSTSCCSPCGMCRQALREFVNDSMPIFMYDIEGRCVVKTLGELLPMSFGPESLPPPDEVVREREAHEHEHGS